MPKKKKESKMSKHLKAFFTIEDPVLREIAKNIDEKKKFFVACAEGVLTTCWGNGIDEDEYHHFEADSLLDAAKQLYIDGWRSINYEGHSSFACPQCLEYLKADGDDWVRESLTTEETNVGK